MKTKLEELRAAYEATEGGMSGEDSELIPTVDCRFYDLAHNLMAQLLEAVNALKEIEKVLSVHPEVGVGNTVVHYAYFQAHNILESLK